MGETGGTHTSQAMGLATSTDPGTQSLVILPPPPHVHCKLISRLFFVDSKMKIKPKAVIAVAADKPYISMSTYVVDPVSCFSIISICAR